MSQYQEMNCPSKAPRSVGKTLQRVREARRKQNKLSVKVSPGGQGGEGSGRGEVDIKTE